MRQVFRIGTLVSGLLIAGAGCASMDWFKGTQGSETDQPKEARRVSEADGKARNQVQTLQVQFGFDKADLDDAAQTALLVLTKKLRDNPKLTVDLEGYADSVGSRDYNLWLSQKRVKAVRQYLLQRGVEPARIRSAGVGQLADGGAAAERAKNRRVTVKLMIASN